MASARISLLELDPHRVIFELPLSLEQSASGDSCLEEVRQAHIERYAGSTQVDSDGRRLDRRGFDEAKHQLFYMHGQQQRFCEEHGRYQER